MEFDGNRAFQHLKQISFGRLAGSKGEKKAAAIIEKFLRGYGFKPETESFPVWTYEEKQASLEVLSPYRKKYRCAAVGLSGSTPLRGITAPFRYVETGTPDRLKNCRGVCAMFSGGVDAKACAALSEEKAAGFIQISPVGGDLIRKSSSPEYWKGRRKVPGVMVLYANALEMIQRKAARVRLVLRQDERKSTSQNVVCEIKGSSFKDEVVLLGGHYDGVDRSPAAHDNASGAAILLEIARCFKAAKPQRTLRFIWFGAEEIGLRGSLAYVKRHHRMLEDIRLMVNLDIAGPIIGQNNAFITGPDPLKNYIEAMGKEEGMDFSVSVGLYSSDNVPFSDKGIPATSITRGGGLVTYGHTTGDVPEDIDGEHLAMTGSFVQKFVERLAKAKEFPFPREIPDDKKKEITEYLLKRRAAKKR